MQFTRVAPLAFVVLLAVVIQVHGLGGLLGGLGPLKALKGLKNAAPLIGGAGLLGALKLALLSKAGLALGTVGTALGASALANQLKQEPEVYYYGGHDSYGHSSYGGHGGYEHGWRRRRDAGEDIDTEEAFEQVKRSDPTRCTERLVCEIASKAAFNPSQLHDDEAGILSIVTSNKHSYRSAAHNQLEGAMREGYRNINCQALYSSCEFNSAQMMDLVRVASQSFYNSSPMSVKQFIAK